MKIYYPKKEKKLWFTLKSHLNSPFKQGSLIALLFSHSIMIYNNSPSELQEFIILPDNGTDDPNKDHYNVSKQIQKTLLKNFPRISI